MVGMVDIACQEVPNTDRSWYFKEMLRVTDQFRACAKTLYPTEYDRAYGARLNVRVSRRARSVTRSSRYKLTTDGVKFAKKL